MNQSLAFLGDLKHKLLLRGKYLQRSHFTVLYYLIFLTFIWKETKPLLINCRFNNDMDVLNNEEDAPKIESLDS